MSISIVYSALGSSVSQQVLKQFPESPLAKSPILLERYERLAHAITLLHVHGLLTDSETERARRRLTRMLAKDLRVDGGGR